MLGLQLSQGSGAAGVSLAKAVTSRCDSGAHGSSLCHARFDDRKAAGAVGGGPLLNSGFPTLTGLCGAVTSAPWSAGMWRRADLPNC